MTTPHLTKLEQYVFNHQYETFERIAADLNRTISSIERAYDRLARKLRNAGVWQ